MLTIDAMDITDASRLAKFDALRLPRLQNHPSPAYGINALPDDDDGFKPKEGEEHGVVIGDTVLTVEPEMTAEGTEAVQYSTFYAQIYANSKFSKDTHVIEWYREYIQVLVYMGWNMTSFSLREQQTSDTSVSVDKIALQMLAAAAGPGAAGAVLMASIKAGLAGLQENKKAVGLFNKESSNSKNASFQMMPAGERANGTPVILLNSMYCSTKINKGKVLFVSWNKSDIRIWGNAQRMELLRDIYAKIRAKVEEELTDYLVSGFHEKFKLERKPK